MNKFPEHAKYLFIQGLSCSESVVKAAYESDLLDKNIDIELLTQISLPFSGGMGTNQCLCGAVAGSQIVLGLVFGRKNAKNGPNQTRAIAKSFVDKFKEKRKATCCGVLSGKLKNDPKTRRAHCTEIVGECAELVQEIVKEKIGVSV